MTATPAFVLEYGDPEVAYAGEILRTTVGSGVHGLAIKGSDDNDEMGIYIEPERYVLGLQGHREDYTARTQPEGERSGPGDTDLIMYGLRKYMRLAVKGNPTALLPLYAPVSHLLACTRLGQDLRNNRHWFLSQQAVERFLGYMHAQHERMMGRGKRNRVPSRPELVAAHGYDTKYASHALRLAYQGYEIASEGTLTLPLSPGVRDHVLFVKRGERQREEVSADITLLETNTRNLLDSGRTPVPPEPDIQAIERWMIAAQTQFWRGYH